MASSAKTGEITPVGPEKGSKIFFEKVNNFSVLDERDCQMALVFAHWGPFGHQRRAWPHAADSPHFHLHRGKIGQFFPKYGSSPEPTLDYVQIVPSIHCTRIAKGVYPIPGTGMRACVLDHRRTCLRHDPRQCRLVLRFLLQKCSVVFLTGKL